MSLPPYEYAQDRAMNWRIVHLDNKIRQAKLDRRADPTRASTRLPAAARDSGVAAWARSDKGPGHGVAPGSGDLATTGAFCRR